MIAENRDDASFLWENEYHQDTGINEYLLTIYQLEDPDNDLFSRCDELHYQRAYATELVQSLAEEAGLTCKAVYQAFTREPVKPDNERIYYIFQN